MDVETAQRIARFGHGTQLDRFGELQVDHVERVAASLTGDARTIAYLHDLLEHTPVSVADLEAEGVTPLELEAVLLLTRQPAESFEMHALRIAHAGGPAGSLARAVKLADIDDHMASETRRPSTRPYKWARFHIRSCQARLDRRPAEPALA
jgi:hypothetical protein